MSETPAVAPVSSPAPSASPSPRRQIIAIGGGKGGVGKSLIAANVAIAMAQKGLRVVVVDASTRFDGKA